MTPLSQIRSITQVLLSYLLGFNLMPQLPMTPALLKLSEKIQRVIQHYKKKVSAPKQVKR